MFALLAHIPWGMWVLYVILFVAIFATYGIVRAIASQLLGILGFLFLWSYTPQLGPWQAWGLYLAVGLPTAINSLLFMGKR